MKMSLSLDGLQDYVKQQCRHFFPDDGKCLDSAKNALALDEALARTEECFRHITLRNYADEDGALFSHLHSDQYSMFLYFYANSLWKTAENEDFARKLTILNRAISGTFVSYKCPLPPHFLFGHAVGTVIGNASYGDCAVFFQNVTVNTGDDQAGGGRCFRRSETDCSWRQVARLSERIRSAQVALLAQMSVCTIRRCQIIASLHCKMVSQPFAKERVSLVLRNLTLI